MATNNITILFWLYRAKINQNNKAPIYVRLTYNNQRKNFSTSYLIEPQKWDTKKHKVKGANEEANTINSYLQQSQNRFINIYNDMLKEGDIDLNKIIEKFFGKDVPSMTILELIKYHNNDFKKRIGIDYSYSTFEKYDILRRKIELFIPYQYSKSDIRLKDLNLNFASDFDFYLKQKDGNQHNTVAKYIKNLKKILTVAVAQGWIKQSPFNQVKTAYKDVERVYLTTSELKAIEAKEFKLERLNLVKDIFLFQCYTGLSYGDMELLTNESITLGIDDGKWIIINRKKTDVRSSIPLLPAALSILDKYTHIQKGNKLLPFYAIQKFNSYLHEIADLCGINKNLTSHAARRTFATTIALQNGVSLETISKILGHSNTNITKIYAVVTDQKISEEMRMLKEKMS